MTYWPADDIGRRADDQPEAADAATEVGADDASSDESIEMLGRLLVYAVIVVAALAFAAIWIF